MWFVIYIHFLTKSDIVIISSMVGFKAFNKKNFNITEICTWLKLKQQEKQKSHKHEEPKIEFGFL